MDTYIPLFFSEILYLLLETIPLENIMRVQTIFYSHIRITTYFQVIFLFLRGFSYFMGLYNMATFSSFQCAKFLDDQTILHWQSYTRKRMRLVEGAVNAGAASGAATPASAIQV